MSQPVDRSRGSYLGSTGVDQSIACSVRSYVGGLCHAVAPRGSEQVGCRTDAHFDIFIEGRTAAAGQIQIRAGEAQSVKSQEGIAKGEVTVNGREVIAEPDGVGYCHINRNRWVSAGLDAEAIAHRVAKSLTGTFHKPREVDLFLGEHQHRFFETRAKAEGTTVHVVVSMFELNL